jgi:hypothetical protein
MRSIIADIFTFLVERARILFLIISIAVLLEGIFYSILSAKSKEDNRRMSNIFISYPWGIKR